jgi:hypothetical protein
MDVPVTDAEWKRVTIPNDDQWDSAVKKRLGAFFPSVLQTIIAEYWQLSALVLRREEDLLFLGEYCKYTKAPLGMRRMCIKRDNGHGREEWDAWVPGRLRIVADDILTFHTQVNYRQTSFPVDDPGILAHAISAHLSGAFITTRIGGYIKVESAETLTRIDRQNLKLQKRDLVIDRHKEPVIIRARDLPALQREFTVCCEFDKGLR